MNGDPLAPPSQRPLWLVTLADLALLLLGFVVLLQASANRDAVANALRARFGAEEIVPAVAAVAADFAPGSARLDDAAPLIAWTADALRDPRVSVTVTGSAAAGEGGSVVLAADRARAALDALAAADLPIDRLQLATSRSGGARVILTLAFTGQPRSQP
jgi:hypothetical protein